MALKVQRRFWFVPLLALNGATGCAVESGDTLTEDEIGSTQQAILRGEASAVNFGIVRLERSGASDKPCTGYFVSKRHIITSAHCTDELYANGKKYFKILTKSGYDSSGYVRDRSRSDNWVLVHQQIHPKWNYQDQKTKFDMAILTLPKTATAGTPSSANLMRVSTATPEVGSKHGTWGWGGYKFKQGKLVLSEDLLFGDPVTVTSSGSGLFKATGSGDALPCKGDSGAPSTRLYNGHYVATGTLRGNAFDTPCASPGDKLLWSDVANKTKWIRATLKSDGVTCTVYKGDYLKCF